jgi:hypothetical protein
MPTHPYRRPTSHTRCLSPYPWLRAYTPPPPVQATNIGQHTRMILLKLGLKHTKTYFVVGVGWAF